MSRDEAVSVLQAHETELKALGVKSVSIFGSVARGESGRDSDLDLAMRFADHFSRPGFDFFGQLEQLKNRLSVIAGCRVDVIEEPARKTHLQAEIDRDRTVVF